MGRGWLQENFIGLIEQAIADSGSDQQVYVCDNGNDGMEVGLILLTPDQYEYLETQLPELPLEKILF